MLTFSHPGSRIQGSKRHPIPDPGSGPATLHTGTLCTYVGRPTAQFRFEQNLIFYLGEGYFLLDFEILLRYLFIVESFSSFHRLLYSFINYNYKLTYRRKNRNNDVNVLIITNIRVRTYSTRYIGKFFRDIREFSLKFM
jgi:hypothetical protein